MTAHILFKKIAWIRCVIGFLWDKVINPKINIKVITKKNAQWPNVKKFKQFKMAAEKKKKIKEKQEVKNLHVCAQNRETARCVKGTQSRDQLASPLSHQSRFVPHPQSLQSHF